MNSGSTNYQNGLAAEDIAARHYVAQGATELARRWKTRDGEIDLIVMQTGTIIFVEVKARKTLDDAAQAMTSKQQRRLANCAQQYLATNADLNADCRFDLAMVDRIGTCKSIENILIG